MRPWNQFSSMPLMTPSSIEPEPRSSRWANSSSAWRSISSVSSSTNQEPPSGSATWATFVSYASTCWVRSAMRAAFSVGSAIASSIELVCRRLRAPEDPGECLHRGPDDVDLRLLGRERHPCGLGVEPQLHRALQLRAVAVVEPPGPDAARRPVLGDLLEEVDVGVEEEAQPGREGIDGQARLQRQLDVGEAVGEGEGQLLRGRRAGLADVVAGDRDRVPARHLRGGEVHGVAHQPHRLAGREHELLLGLVLLQDVVLEGAAQAGAVHAGLLGLRDEHGEDDRGRGVDGHRRGDRVEVDPRVEVLHVGKGVDGHAAAADLAQ